MAKVELGGKYRHRASGFIGTAINRVEYLDNPIQRVGLTAVTKDGRLMTEYFDESALDPVRAVVEGEPPLVVDEEPVMAVEVTR